MLHYLYTRNSSDSTVQCDTCRPQKWQLILFALTFLVNYVIVIYAKQPMKFIVTNLGEKDSNSVREAKRVKKPILLDFLFNWG